MAFAKNIYDASWNCKVDEGLAGLTHCRWAPSGRHILTVSDFKLRLTLWNLVDRSVQYIQFPKHEDAGIDFSPDGSLLAVVLKHQDEVIVDNAQDRSDIIGLYHVRTIGKWECIHKFSVGSTEVADIKFTRDGAHLVVWDSPL